MPDTITVDPLRAMIRASQARNAACVRALFGLPEPTEDAEIDEDAEPSLPVVNAGAGTAERPQRTPPGFNTNLRNLLL